jgi:H3 lysine-79-specific histone-lysine N-methyltransferase
MACVKFVKYSLNTFFFNFFHLFIKNLLFQTKAYRVNVEKEHAVESKKNAELVKREKQLKSQIDNLISDSLALLKRRLDELGIQAKTPPEFIEKAKMIVCNHHELQRNKASLESEVAKLEQAQNQMLIKKERELMENAIRSSGLSQIEARTLAKRKIDSVLNNNSIKTSAKDHAILGLSSEVIVTKCPADQLPITTQIRKRPRDALGKQKDWPEKRHKDSPANTSPVKPVPVIFYFTLVSQLPFY